MASRNPSIDGATEIRAGTRIKGRVQGNEDLLVAGRIEGHIEIDGRLSVEDGGVVKADVRASRVRIAGTVVGNVTASELLELAPSARVQGDLRAPSVRIEDGAKLSGVLEVGDVSRIQVAPRREARPAPASEESGGKKKTQVTGFVPAPAAQDERRRKRVVVKKRS